MLESLPTLLTVYPDFFKECSSLKEVKKQLSEFNSLDFDLGKNKIPQRMVRHAFDNGLINKDFIDEVAKYISKFNNV